MTKEKIERINALARKAKTEGLTPAELEEQKALRDEYREEYRRSLMAHLSNIDIKNEDGSIEPLIKQ